MLEVDALVRRIFLDHFAGAGAVEPYFEAVELFARDAMPPCVEREALLDPHDPRRPFSGTHRMAGDVMWFAWAEQLECAQLVAPPDRDEQAVRTVLLAGVAVGCSVDFRFTGRCRTRREYDAPDDVARARILERGRCSARDFEAAAAEVRDLFYIRSFSDD